MSGDGTAALADSLAAFQADLPRIGKGRTADAGTYKYTYADLATVSAAVMPLLAEHGLCFTSSPAYDDGGRFVLHCRLLHTSGEKVEGAFPLPSGTPQQVGSAITYARRYVLCSMTGVAPDDEDDDGAAASAVRPTPALVDLVPLYEAIAAAKTAGLEGDYDATLEWAEQSQANADAALSKIRKAMAEAEGVTA